MIDLTEEIMKKIFNTLVALILLVSAGNMSFAAAPQHQYKPKSPVIVLNEKVEYITLQTPTAICVKPKIIIYQFIIFP